MISWGASAGAQPPDDGISFEAASMSFDLKSGSSVFTDVTASDGAISLHAARGTTTKDAARAGKWEFAGGLQISFESAILTADRGTFRYAGGRFTEGELLGAPATLEAGGGDGSRAFKITAGRIAYDGRERQLTLSDAAVMTSDGVEIKNCNWTFDFDDNSVRGSFDEAGKCLANVATESEPGP